jgi:carbonic anhydrase
MTTKERMLLESKVWVQEKLSLDQNYFEQLSHLHTPNILWIGSTDSLVPVRELTNTEPGEILVYRNMGGQVREDDISLLTTIEHAIEVSGIDYIIYCGYSHCGSIRDIIHDNDKQPRVKKWLEGLNEIYDNNQRDFEALAPIEKAKKLCEMNIRQQIINLSKIDTIQNAWERNDKPILLGLYFELTDGTLREVYSMENNHKKRVVAEVTSGELL